MQAIRQHVIWGRRGTFILAATGSAVGLGNIWKFPYITGEHGGGAFLLMYLVCLCLIGIPILVAEILLGRHGRANPISSMGRARRESGAGRGWTLVGWMGVLAAFLILSYYTVVAGWVLEYLAIATQGSFTGLDTGRATAIFDDLLDDKSRLVQWQTAFIAMTALVLIFDINRGLQFAIWLMMPLLFLLLVVLVIYAAYAGDFAAGVDFMFSIRLENLSWNAALVALGHAFFTLSLAMGAIMAYGAYMPGDQPVIRSAVTIACLDTLVAVAAGLAIFPLVFATPGMAPGAGPGLLFVTLPVAFGGLPWGDLLAVAFFLLVALAAWTSTIALLEPGVAYLTERFKFHRISANLLIAGGAWVLGLGTVFSFNDWADFTPLWGMTVFGLIDFITTNILLPLGGLSMAIFVGWLAKRELVEQELRFDMPRLVRFWYWVLRYVTPVLICVVLAGGLYPLVSGFLDGVH